jgi:hypothetical protein
MGIGSILLCRDRQLGWHEDTCTVHSVPNQPLLQMTVEVTSTLSSEVKASAAVRMFWPLCFRFPSCFSGRKFCSLRGINMNEANCWFWESKNREVSQWPQTLWEHCKPCILIMRHAVSRICRRVDKQDAPRLFRPDKGQTGQLIRRCYENLCVNSRPMERSHLTWS